MSFVPPLAELQEYDLPTAALNGQAKASPPEEGAHGLTAAPTAAVAASKRKPQAEEGDIFVGNPEAGLCMTHLFDENEGV